MQLAQLWDLLPWKKHVTKMSDCPGALAKLVLRKMHTKTSLMKRKFFARKAVHDCYRCWKFQLKISSDSGDMHFSAIKPRWGGCPPFFKSLGERVWTEHKFAPPCFSQKRRCYFFFLKLKVKLKTTQNIELSFGLRSRKCRHRFACCGEHICSTYACSGRLRHVQQTVGGGFRFSHFH